MSNVEHEEKVPGTGQDTEDKGKGNEQSYNDQESSEQGRGNGHREVEAVERAFSDAMEAQGFGTVYIPADSCWHNFAAPGSSHDSESAKLNYGPNPHGVVKSFRDPDLFWRWDYGQQIEFSTAEMEELGRKQAEQAAEEKSERDRIYNVMYNWFSALPPAKADHPYLVRKKIDLLNCPCKQDGDKLILPLYNFVSGELQTVQTIGPEGDKFYYTGLSTKLACCFPRSGNFSLHLDRMVRTLPLYVCEGYATGYAIGVATTYSVICAMSTGNLKAIVEAARRKWPLEPLIVIGADNDTETEAQIGFNPGIKTANAAARAITNCKVAIPPPGDFSDLYVSQGAAAVKAVLEAATEPPPDTGSSEQASNEQQQQRTPPYNDAQRAKLAWLAGLSAMEYDQRREEAAEWFGVRLGTLDEMVAEFRPPPEAEPGQGTAIEFEEIIPWTESVEGAALVRDLEAAIKKHVILTDEQALAVALWIMHAHALDCAEHSPRLHVASPVKRCGKTRLLNTVAPMVPRPLLTENISQAAMFRVIEKWKTTLLMDEADILLKDNEDLRKMINAGHGRNGKATLCAGDDHDVRLFSVWAPVVIAGIGYIPDTIEDRSITISLRRRKKNEEITRLRSNRTGYLKDIGRRVARWIDDHRISLGNADPALPEDLGDREHDNWRPLIAIADLISAELGKRTREAAITISKDETKDDEGANVLCLGDVAKIFVDKKADHLSSDEIVRELCRMQERPWSSWRKGNPMSPLSLARLLKPFGIKPEQIRIGTAAGDKIRGYHAAPVKEAKERYVTNEEESTEQPF